MNYMVHVFNIMWRIKNEPSDSTSCSDNVLRLLVLVAGRWYWRCQVTSSFSIWGCILKECFWERSNLKVQIAFEGHWRLQSWTLVQTSHAFETWVFKKLLSHIIRIDWFEVFFLFLFFYNKFITPFHLFAAFIGLSLRSTVAWEPFYNWAFKIELIKRRSM